MEELTNIKLDWNIILGKQIDTLQEQFPDLEAAKLFKPIIDLLSSNMIQSRVVISRGEVCAYSYILPSGVLDDRIICTIGFMRDSEDNMDKAETILKWMDELSARSGKLIIIDNMFNGTFLNGILENQGYTMDRRMKMKSPLKNIMERKDETEFTGILNRETIILKVDEVDIDKMRIAQYNAYCDSPEHYLLYRKDGKNLTYDILFNGYYGKFMPSPSCVLYKDGVVAACIITDGREEFINTGVPLIVDIFVNKEFRDKGFSSFLIRYAAEKLQLLGHTEIQLWVNENSKARSIYRDIGFMDTGEIETLYWKDFRKY